MTRVRTALVALASGTALLLTVTGCAEGGGGDDRPKPSSARTADARGEQEARAESPGKPAASAKPRAAETSRTPKVPKARLTAATGSFTKKQQRYLEGRVPKGIDPAAIAVSGEEICQRITRTEEADRKAVIDAIRTGEIAGAKPAITHLCPQHKDLLTAAGA